MENSIPAQIPFPQPPSLSHLTIMLMIPHQPPPHHHHPDRSQPTNPGSVHMQYFHPPSHITTTTHAPCHAPPMHRPMLGPACPSTKNQIWPLLTCRHSDYMILLLHSSGNGYKASQLINNVINITLFLFLFRRQVCYNIFLYW